MLADKILKVVTDRNEMIKQAYNFYIPVKEEDMNKTTLDVIKALAIDDISAKTVKATKNCSLQAVKTILKAGGKLGRNGGPRLQFGGVLPQPNGLYMVTDTHIMVMAPRDFYTGIADSFFIKQLAPGADCGTLGDSVPFSIFDGTKLLPHDKKDIGKYKINISRKLLKNYKLFCKGYTPSHDWQNSYHGVGDSSKKFIHGDFIPVYTNDGILFNFEFRFLKLVLDLLNVDSVTLYSSFLKNQFYAVDEPKNINVLVCSLRPGSMDAEIEILKSEWFASDLYKKAVTA